VDSRSGPPTPRQARSTRRRRAGRSWCCGGRQQRTTCWTVQTGGLDTRPSLGRSGRVTGGAPSGDPFTQPRRSSILEGLQDRLYLLPGEAAPPLNRRAIGYQGSISPRPMAPSRCMFQVGRLCHVDQPPTGPPCQVVHAPDTGRRVRANT
jgi:hypothetical protein